MDLRDFWPALGNSFELPSVAEQLADFTGRSKARKGLS